MTSLDSPLPPHLFFVLLSLNEAPLHGYGIKKAVAERTDQQVDLDAGGLYRIIARLEEWGWARPAPSPEGGDARRKYYELTDEGRAALREEARRVSALARDPEVAALARAPAAG